MIEQCKKSLCKGLAGLLFICLVGTSLAQPGEVGASSDPGSQIGPPKPGEEAGLGGASEVQGSQPPAGTAGSMPPRDGSQMPGEMGKMTPDKMAYHQMVGFFVGVPIEVLHSGHGIAQKDEESHVLRLNVEVLCPLEPMHVRNLLAANRSVDEIRENIRSRQCDVAYRGSLMLDDGLYPLVNIRVNPLGNNSTALSADLAEPSADLGRNDTLLVGRLSLIVSPSNGGVVGKGELELDHPPQGGKYAVLLSMKPPRHE